MRNPMFVYDDEMTEMILNYCRQRVALEPVPLDFPGTQDRIDPALAGLLNAKGNPAADVLKIFEDHLVETVISCDSPRFLAFIPAAPTKAALLFDMVVSCSSLQGSSWLEAAGPVSAENQVLELLAGLAGLPEGAGGCFVSGGSAGNLSALVVARDTARHRFGAAPPAGRLRVLVSDQAHSSIKNALNVVDMEALVVATTDHRLTGDAMVGALAADPDPASVVAVVATSGTTNAGIIDDLSSVGGVARERNLWFHTDGAYGGAGIFSSLVKQRYAGMALVDSFVVDPHKWLFAPFDCAALIYRTPSLAKGVHTQNAAYLDPIHTEEPSEWNPSDYAYHLTRRARGLALWFSLAVHGTDAYTSAIDAAIVMARRTAEVIRSHPDLELIREPELSVLLFRRVGWKAEEYQRWSDQLLTDQIGFVTPTKWEGETVARFAFLHPETTDEMVAEILDTLAD